MPWRRVFMASFMVDTMVSSMDDAMEPFMVDTMASSMDDTMD